MARGFYGQLLQRFLAATGGNVGMIYAICILPLFGVVGFAVDYARISGERERVLATLDGALLASIAGEDTQSQTAKADEMFTVALAGLGGSVTSKTFERVGDELRGTVTVAMPTTFANVLGIRNMSLTVHSAARKTVSVPAAPCILVLDPSRVQSVLVNSGALLSAPSCELHSRSTASPAAIFNAASNISTRKICLQGTTIIDNGGTHPNLELGCAAAGDPYAATMPPPPSTACTFNGTTYDAPSIAMTPGVYCGWHNFNGAPDVTFAPGVYVIMNGGWNVNGGRWSGAGVTFYFADTSKIQFNSGMEQVLSAPTTGPFKDVLFTETAGLAKSDFIFNNSRGQQFEGLIYLPSRNVTFNSTTRAASERMGMVMNSVIFNSTDLRIEPLNGAGATDQGPVLIR